jgi:hypothetical protein
VITGRYEMGETPRRVNTALQPAQRVTVAREAITSSLIRDV